jgi:hypothetical protein
MSRIRMRKKLGMAVAAAFFLLFAFFLLLALLLDPLGVLALHGTNYNGQPIGGFCIGATAAVSVWFSIAMLRRLWAANRRDVSSDD